MHTCQHVHHNIIQENNTHVPQLGWVILFFKDTSLPSNDNAILVHLLLHVGGVAGPVQGEEERTITHPMDSHLKMTVVHQ